MNCTHVWNYEQTMAHLYPALERTMRLTDYQDNVHGGGAMAFRTTLPLRAGLPVWGKHLPAADGQFGTVVKTYREWRISGDTGWLERLWPAVKRSIEFAWTGFAQWDADKDGVLEGVQHNTYDIEFHGPNSMCGSLYLAALKAAGEMAQAVGDNAAAEECRRVYESGRARYDGMLFNGSYYVQKVILGPGARRDSLRYQCGSGCLSDQLLGQWAAHVTGLGYVLPEGHVKKALSSIFRHNFKPDLSAHESGGRQGAVPLSLQRRGLDRH
jgi:non-lysosomal glucosylceramidase